ncbi:MAG: site-2 protease family protein [Leptolyngbyaceae bacterium]|nr:site-2 protease family protein [Leptolyngbyaceae bacterium]
MNGIRVGNLFGIPFFINPSWFIVFALVTFSYGSDLDRFFNLGGALPWILGMVTALLMFSSVLLHELGHSFVARSQGIEVKSITLFIFGGLASLGEESKTPWDSFWVAIAGPLVSFVLFGIFTAIGIFVDLPAPLFAIVSIVGTINLILGTFNLIPGLPLDGGNILKAIVWKITGKPYKGVAFASRVGQIFGWAGILLGLNSIFDISSAFGVMLPGNIWTLLIGLFLLQNAGRSAQSAVIQEKLSGLTAKDAMYPRSPIVPASLSLREFANEHIIGNPVSWRKYLVTDENGKLIGEIETEAMKTISTSDWWNVTVQSLTKPRAAMQTVDANTSVMDILPRIEQENIDALAVEEDGRIIGVIERISIAEMMQRQSQNAEGADAIAPKKEEKSAGLPGSSD